jgi:integrase
MRLLLLLAASIALPISSVVSWKPATSAVRGYSRLDAQESSVPVGRKRAASGGPSSRNADGTKDPAVVSSSRGSSSSSGSAGPETAWRKPAAAATPSSVKAEGKESPASRRPAAAASSASAKAKAREARLLRAANTSPKAQLPIQRGKTAARTARLKKKVQAAANRLLSAKELEDEEIDGEYLSTRSVSTATAEIYSEAVAEFKEWCKIRQLAWTPVTQLDITLSRYFDFLYFIGEDISPAGNTLFGIMWDLKLPKDRTLLPGARRALAGYRKLVPARSRDPIPIEALFLMIQWLLKDATNLIHVLVAIVMILSFDAYLRPGEAMRLTTADVVKPAGRRYPRWGMILGTVDKPSKNREVDDTVFVGGAKDRLWLQELLATVVSQCPVKSSLFAPLTLGVYEQTFSKAVKACNLELLKICPHSLRHGGASDDFYHENATLLEIQHRGRWKAAASVKRYSKKGKLQRQVNLMTAKQLSAAASYGSKAKDPLLSAAKLLRSMRRKGC